MNDMSTTTRFPCPTCGESEWVAHYMVPESQGVDLFVSQEGIPEVPEVGDYDGGTRRSYDAGDNDFYQCEACGTTITPDGRVDAFHAAAQGDRP